jgi:biopolymer transport protein ExbD
MMNRPEINVTPLIDVLLVLLIIFMVITPMKPSSFDARIPTEPEPDRIAEVNPNTLIVNYDLNGAIRINNEPELATLEDMSQITARLHEVFELREGNLNPERTVFIKAPKGLDYGSVVKMIDAVKAGGAEPISLQIDGID